MAEIKTPESTVLVLKTIVPTEVDRGYLTYPELHVELDAQQKTIGQRWQNLEDTVPESNEERRAARDLAAYYLLKTVEQINETGVDKDLWADRFTRDAEELYDIKPDFQIWSALHQTELSEIKNALGEENIFAEQLNGIYKDFGIGDTIKSTVEVAEVMPNPAWRDYILEHFEGVFTLVEEDKVYDPDAMQKLFTDTFIPMAKIEKDDAWLSWNAEIVDDDKIKVQPKAKIIKIGERREPETGERMKQLIAHELLVHALRAQRGERTGDPELTKGRGLSGYIDAEEGIGVANEAVLSGKVPHKSADRYHDVGLALGLYGGRQLTRPELIKLASLRLRMREPDMASEEADTYATAHANRIFRGGLGSGDKHVHHAVFVKDMMYFIGYQKMTALINERLKTNQPINEFFDWLMQAKFDPTNEKHVEYVNNLDRTG